MKAKQVYTKPEMELLIPGRLMDYTEPIGGQSSGENHEVDAKPYEDDEEIANGGSWQVWED